MSNGNEFATKSPNRIYVTGDCDGLPDLREALGSAPRGRARRVGHAGGRGRGDPDRRAPERRPARDARGDAAGERAGGDPRAHAGAADPARLERLPGPAGGGARARRRRRPAAPAADRQRRLRDPQGRPRRQAPDRRPAPARPARDRLLAQGRHRQDRDRDEPRHLARQALGQAGAAARPRPAVRRRGDHARDRAGEDDLRPRHRSGRARLGEARRLHDQARVRASTSSRRRCARRTPSSSPRRSSPGCSRSRASRTT